VPISNAEFDTLVKRLTREAAARPLWYKTRVLLLAMLGYVYVFGILFGLLAMIGLVILIVLSGRGLLLLKNVAIPLAIFAWVVSKSLWVKFDPPEGRRLSRARAPRLFDTIDDVCRTLRAPRADVVLLTDDYNAAVSQIPRLGVFGWHRDYLIVGLPLMQALPPDEWRGVLAHEFSHLSRAHARFGNWIYRVRKTWYQLMNTLENERRGGGAWMFRRFFHWYAPYFGAYSFVLARRDEFEADKLAATVVGARAMARGLILSGVRSRVLEERFWPEVEREVLTRATPPDNIHSRMASVLRSGLDQSPVRSWVCDRLAVETGSDDTHPAPRDRIAALGVAVDDAMDSGGSPSEPVRVTAAEYFLGDLATEVTAELDSAWQAAASSWWPERHERERSEEEALTSLEQRQASLDDGELWELARLTDARRSADAAEPYLRELLIRIPRHAAASYTLGYNLLSKNDEEGVGLIESAIDIDPEALAPGSRIIAAWLRRRGRTEDAQRYEAQASDAELLQAAALKERESVRRKDSFLPHDVDQAALASLTAALAKDRRVAAAWLARKVLKHKPENPLLVLGVDTRSDWGSPFRAIGIPVGKGRDAGFSQELANTLPLPGDAFVVPLRENAWLRKKMKKVPGATIFRR
jgi:Zn-dependent protease with chaperone function